MRNVKRFTVELDPEEYELLTFLAKDIYKMPKAKIIRNALRHYFSYTILSIYAPEFKIFLDFVRSRLREYGKS